MRSFPHFNGRRMTFAGWLLAGSAVAGFAQAQTAPAATQVQEVIVTATKRSENIQNVPAAITALDAQSLSKAGFVKLEDYVAQVPGLSISTVNPGSMQIAIRGITSGENESSPATSIYVDEAPFGSVNAYAAGSDLTPDLDPAELSQIEVLKGPQGTLYGASAVGGVVKFDSKPVDLDHFGGEVTAGGEVTTEGTAGYTFRGLINMPIVKDVFGLRISAFTREDPGYVKNLLTDKYQNDSKVAGGRADLFWKPTSHISVDAWALIHNINNNGSSAEDVNYQTLQPLYGPLTMKAYTEQPNKFQFEVYNTTVKGQWGALNLTSSTTYQDIRGIAYADATQSSAGILDLTLFGAFGVVANPANTALQDSLASKIRRFSQEFRVSDSFFNGRLDAQAGVFFTHENDLLTIPGYFLFNKSTGAPIEQLFPYNTMPLISAEIASRYTELSGYANLDLHITDRFDVTGGIRESANRQQFLEDYSGTYIAIVKALEKQAGDTLTYGSSSTGRDFNYLVSPRFKIDDNNMVYARFADGYRPGGANAFPPGLGEPATFGPDTVTSYEAGYKSQWFDRTLTLDLALFWNDWNNIQIQTGVAGFQGFINGGTARTRGAELSTLWRPVHGLTFGLNGAYTQANLTTDAPAAGGVAGDELPFVPKWAGSITADYNWPIMDGWTGDVGGSVNYVGVRKSGFVGNGATINGYGVPAPSFTTLNVNAGVTHGPVTFQAFVRNIGNSHGIVYVPVLAAPILTNYNTASVIPPLTFGGQITVAF
ncbi:MAG TPA: TonB-dependent receptor plug domain-containing protein [Caulobacteraceae bacterium]|nr:TonB-dependent receptor plug domain-containing protein [Caulobacteraceae bacterium]